MTAGAWHLEIHDELPSTSDEVIRRAEAGAPAGLAVLARRQTKARGSRGRVWTEPEGNLALSVLLRPARDVGENGQAAFRAALALIEALDPHAGTASLALKWPNDVLLDGSKLAGILVESAVAADRLAWMAIGFGANLRARPVLPGAPPTACLSEGGLDPVAPEIVAERLLDRLDHWLAQDFATVRTAWLRRAHPVGTALVVDGRAGRFAGISATGALLLDDPGGRREIATGQVFAPALAAARHHTN